MSKAGIVLGGGYARRFDEGDKTLADFEGRPLIAHAIEPLQSVVGTVVVSCRAEQVEAFERVLDDVEFVPDPEPDEGPLAGLDAALQRVEADAVAVATADRPCVPSTLYSQFFETLDADGVVIDADGIRQPAPAVFDTRALRGEVQRHCDSGERRLRSILADLDVDLLGVDTVRDQWGTNVLTDVNTVAELDRLRRDGC